jgi:hypothetical protein
MLKSRSEVRLSPVCISATTRPIVPFPVDRWWWWWWWWELTKENWSTRETFPSATLSSRNPRSSDPGSKPFPPHWKAGDYPLELWRDLFSFLRPQNKFSFAVSVSIFLTAMPVATNLYNSMRALIRNVDSFSIRSFKVNFRNGRNYLSQYV